MIRKTNQISNGVKKYKILEHKADLKIRAFGKDKKELFLNAMLGVFGGAGYQEETQAPSKRAQKLNLK